MTKRMSIEENRNLSQAHEEYLKRKNQIINNFINSTTMDFANKIYSTYPYSLEYSNVSSYREHFKLIFATLNYSSSHLFGTLKTKSIV